MNNLKVEHKSLYGVSKIEILAINKSEILNKTHEAFYCVAYYPFIAFFM